VAFEAEAERVNHLAGFDKNWVIPNEGDVERGGTGEMGDNES